MAIVIKRKLKLVESEPLVQDNEIDDAVDMLIIELARQAAWDDHVESLMQQKAKKCHAP
jgi:hypothetical protein